MVVLIARNRTGHLVRMKFSNEENAKSYAKRLILRKLKIVSIIHVASD